MQLQNLNSAHETQNSVNSFGPSLSMEQNNQILLLLGKENGVPSSANLVRNFTALYTCQDNSYWIIDLGATDHMTYDLSSLNSLGIIESSHK